MLLTLGSVAISHMALFIKANDMHDACCFPKVNESIPLITLSVKHLTKIKCPKLKISISTVDTILYFNYLSWHF